MKTANNSRQLFHMAGAAYSSTYHRRHSLPYFALLLGAFILFTALPSGAQEEKAVATFNKANEYYSKGQFSKAIILYRKARAEGISFPTCSFNIGNCYYQAGDLPAAAAAYRSATNGDDKVATDALLNLAGVLYRLGNYGESIAAYRRGLAYAPDNVSGWLYLSEAYEKTGDYAGTLQSLEKALALQPDDVSIVYQLAETHVALNDIPQALGLIKKAYTLNPAETDFLFYAADLHLLNSDTSQAITAYREALSADPNSASGHYRLADILAANGQQFLAMEHLTTALSIKPDFTDAALFLGNITFDLQWWDRAADAYTIAVLQGDQEGIIGIVNIVQEFVKKNDRTRAREIAKVLEGVQIKDAMLKREWEKVTLELQ